MSHAPSSHLEHHAFAPQQHYSPFGPAPTASMPPSAISMPTRPTPSLSTSSAFSANALPNEDWTKISDLAERRRIQNRIAQRNYRKKLKRRLEDFERKQTPDSASPEPENADPDQQPAKSLAGPIRRNHSPQAHINNHRKSSASAGPTRQAQHQQLPPTPEPQQHDTFYGASGDPAASFLGQPPYLSSHSPPISYASYNTEHTKYSPQYQSWSSLDSSEHSPYGAPSVNYTSAFSKVAGYPVVSSAPAADPFSSYTGHSAPRAEWASSAFASQQPQQAWSGYATGHDPHTPELTFSNNGFESPVFDEALITPPHSAVDPFEDLLNSTPELWDVNGEVL